MTSNQFSQAGDLFLRADDAASAASAFERAGDRVKAANLRGEVALKEGRVAEAATAFRDGQDYLRAAELFESINEHAEAAAAFEAGESHAAAGSVYIRAGLPERAAQAYERSGELETAARLFEQAGNQPRAIALYERAGLTFKSGEAAAASGDRDRAIALLQQVVPSDEHYGAAAALLGQLFVESGRAGLAVERLQKAIGGKPVSMLNLDLYYWLAAAHEKDNPAEAVALYKRIQAESLHFREVGARLAALELAQASRPQVDRRKPVSPALVAPQPVAPTPEPAPPPPPAPVATPEPAPVPRPAPPPQPVPAAVVPVPAPAPVPAPVVISPPVTTPAVPIGQRFIPREEIGRGPLGIVFRAEDVTDGRDVALRVLPNALFASDGLASAVAADLRAASASASQRHPGPGPRGSRRPARRGHRVRARPQLRRGHPQGKPDDPSAGPQHRVRAGPVSRRRPRPGPRPRVDPAVQHHGGGRGGEGGRPRPRPPRPGYRPASWTIARPSASSTSRATSTRWPPSCTT